MAFLSYPRHLVVPPDLPAGPEVPDADPGPAPHQPAAGERVSVRARGANAPHWEEPRAAETSGGLLGPVPKWSPEGAKQEVSPGHGHTHARTHKGSVHIQRVLLGEMPGLGGDLPIGPRKLPHALGMAFVCSCIHSFIHLFNKYLLRTYSVPSTGLGVWDPTPGKVGLGPTLLKGRQMNQPAAMARAEGQKREVGPGSTKGNVQVVGGRGRGGRLPGGTGI